ncbi:guanylate kinase [Granulicella tundricola]|uniref:Guanylate kinase n=1 Tax=Granulicella tundricola (strain ATCC BAA-1859 / DSM 23138 / MP5ACTX9) TaxID=1198114 RepID=E8WWH5_GRATM|nr:guanylate kinase [Granulicella tundricola]ADW69639.1 guanylate kinase [Granulicella tundricola MP5ACTX9]
MAGILFIISAPSGSGKSTLVSQLRTLVEGLDFSISYTTRAPRGSEEDGREYHFTTRERFEEMIAAGEFLEWAQVFGNYYGTALSALDHAKREGKDLLLDIDVQGAVQVMKKLPAAVSIFILPPSPQVLERRLRNRSEAEHVTAEDVIARRLAEAQKELDRVGEYKYALVNDVLDDAVTEMKAVVLKERGEPLADGELAASCETSARSARLVAALGSFGRS